jgi:hypothetical protein
MNATMLWVGFLVPPIVSFIKNVRWPARAKFLASLVVSFVVTVVTSVIQGEIGSVSDFLQNAAVTWSAAQTWYHLHFGYLDINKTLENMIFGSKDE